MNGFCLSSMLLPLLLASPAMAERVQQNLIGGELKFHGNVLSLPCSVASDDEKLLVDFKEVSVKDLYIHGKSTPTPFSLHLVDCSPNVFHSVTVTFSGHESNDLPGHLTINPSGSEGASGIAIGLMQGNGSKVELDKETPATALVTGNMTLKFMAYVAGEPDALKNSNIQYGPFTASANYTLNYQ